MKPELRLQISAYKASSSPKVKSCYNPLRLGTVIILSSSLGTVIVLISSGIDFINTPCLYSDPSHPPREIANLVLWFVSEEVQSAWTSQETHRNSTSYARDEVRTSECLLDRQTP